MEMIKILTPFFSYEDERGLLVQLLEHGAGQINVVKSCAGCVRGGHYHKLNKELFYIIYGEVKLVLKVNDKVETFCFHSGDMFEIMANVVHDFTYLQGTCLIAMYDHGVILPDGTKDIYS